MRATDERDWWNRRELVRSLGLTTMGLAAGCGTDTAPPQDFSWSHPAVTRSARYGTGRPMTLQRHAASFGCGLRPEQHRPGNLISRS